MDHATLQAERPNHKSENVFFSDSDGMVWFLFGATLDCILAERCYFRNGELYFGTLVRLPYDTFNAWTERSDIINVDGEASFVVDSVEALPLTLSELTTKAQSAGLIGLIDQKRVSRKYRKLLQNPGDCDGDTALLMGMAIADTFIGTGYPGYIPVTQKLACDIADLV